MSVTFSYNFLLSFLCVIICWSRYVYARFQTCCSFRSDSVSAVTAAKTYFSDKQKCCTSGFIQCAHHYFPGICLQSTNQVESTHHLNGFQGFSCSMFKKDVTPAQPYNYLYSWLNCAQLVYNQFTKTKGIVHQ